MHLIFGEILLMLLAFLSNTNAQIPVLKCPTKQPELNACMQEYSQTIINECQRNNPLILPLNPNYIEKLQLVSNTDMVFNLRNVEIFFAPIIVTGVDFDINTGLYVKNLTTKVATLDSDVCGIGTLNDKQEKVCGHSVISVVDIQGTYRSIFFKKDLGRIQVYQVQPGTGEITADLSAGIFGLMDMKCIGCKLTADDENKLKDLFLATKDDFLLKFKSYAIDLIDEGLNTVLRVQDANNVFYN